MIEAVCMDYVIVAGQRIKRPSWISRSAWLWQWELFLRKEHGEP